VIVEAFCSFVVVRVVTVDVVTVVVEVTGCNRNNNTNINTKRPKLICSRTTPASTKTVTTRAYDSDFCFDIWRATNADYSLTYLIKALNRLRILMPPGENITVSVYS